MKRKVVYVISNVSKSLAFEWVAVGLIPHFDISFILLNPTPSPLEAFLVNNGIPTKRLNYRGKKNFALTFLRLLFFFVRQRPRVVHAHLLDAQLVALPAAWCAGVKSRIYTRHNSVFHHKYYRKGIFYDLLSNRFATKIVSISQATDRTLRELESVSSKKIVHIHHGFDITDFDDVSVQRVTHIREKWKIPNGFPIVGVVARHIEWKGIQFIIPAFQQLLEHYENAVLVLANAIGPYHREIVTLLDTFLPRDRYVLIPFEEDISALFQTFTIYVHVPIDDVSEAFGQTYIESLICKVPSIFTLSGIAAEFVEHRRNAMVVPYMDSDAIYSSLLELTNDEDLRSSLRENGRNDVVSQFGVDKMINALQELYGG